VSRVLTLAGRTGTGRVGAAIAALVILFAALWMGAAIGETAIPFKTVAQAVANRLWNAGYPLAPIDEGIIWSYRLSRAVVAASCGAALALSGAVLQSLLRNPLADPYILGISAGASTGAVSVAILGVGAGMLTLPLGAFIGALVAFVLVSLLAVKAGRGTAAIILAGVAGSQLFNALTSFIVTKAATAEQARGIMFWLLGNLSGVRWPDAWLAVPATLLGLVVCLWHARPLDAFTFGSESAASLGISVRRTYFALVGVSAMMTAVMVSIVGSIGFVGLVIPHAARMLVGVRHGVLLPAAALIGAVFMILADILSRVLIPGQVLPIGVITALVGAPAFALILGQRRDRA
jgi:iron complex transport system permease protein